MKILGLMLFGLSELVKAQTNTTAGFNLNYTYAENLPCTTCITGGWNYCFKGRDGDRSKSGDDSSWDLEYKWQATCCKDNTCSEMNKRGYTCSAFYRQREYALTMCPESRRKCGSKKEVRFNAEGEEEKLRVFNLTAGQKCSFKLNAKCGSPFFKVDDWVNSDSTTGLMVNFIEYDWAKTKKKHSFGLCDGHNSNSKNKFYCLPQSDLPPRDYVFGNQGAQGTEGGQYIPKKNSRGKWKSKKKVRGKKDDKRDLDNIPDDDDSYVGLGKPVTGWYNAKKKGSFKAFGLSGLGDKSKGGRKKKDKKCAKRRVLVTVAAIPNVIVQRNETYQAQVKSNTTSNTNTTSGTTTNTNTTSGSTTNTNTTSGSTSNTNTTSGSTSNTNTTSSGSTTNTNTTSSGSTTTNTNSTTSGSTTNDNTTSQTTTSSGSTTDSTSTQTTTQSDPAPAPAPEPTPEPVIEEAALAYEEVPVVEPEVIGGELETVVEPVSSEP
jgi:hypothetical protein